MRSLRQLLGGEPVEERAVSDAAWSNAWAAGDNFARTPDGRTIDSTAAQRVLTVYGCVSLISGTIATLPVQVQRLDADGRATQVSRYPAWVDQPNVEIDQMTFVETMLSHLLLDGNAYLAPTRDASGRTVEVWLLHPHDVWVQRSRATGDVEYWMGGKPYPGEVVHVRSRWLDRIGIKGLSPVEAARQNLGLAMNEVDHGNRYYSQGTTMPVVIKLATRPTVDEARFLRDSWVREHGGVRKAWLPGVIWGDADVKPIGVNNQQAQFLEARQFSAAEIAGQMFLLDPTELGIGVAGASLTYQNIESRMIHLSRRLLPWMRRVEEAMTYLLPRPQRWRFNVNALLRADLMTRYQAYAVGLSNGFLTLEEVRDWEDLRPLPSSATPTPTGVSNEPTAPAP